MFRETDIILALGRRESGKSFLGRQVQKLYPRKVIFDTLNEYSEEAGDSIHVYSWSQFSEKLLDVLARDEKRFTIIYHFDLETENNEIEFNEALRVLFYMGNCTIVVEEIQHYSTPHSLPLWLKNCLFQGRHRRLSMIFTTQRPGACNKSLLSQCSHIFCGSLHEKHDVDYVRSLFREKADELLSIPQRWFLLFRPGHPIVKVHNSLAQAGQGDPRS